MTQPELTVVCGTRHREACFRRFLQSVADTATVPTELIIADASDDQNRYAEAAVAGLRTDNNHLATVRIIEERPRQGVVKGYNRAFRMATAPYVAWMNDDCEMIAGWDRIALDFMERWPEVGMGLVYFTEDSIHPPKSPGEKFYVQQWKGMYSANFGVVPRAVGNAVGWFDEREVFVPFLNRPASLSFYGCDNSLTFLVIDAGFAVVPIPGCRVHHYREQDNERAENMRQHVAIHGGRLSGIILEQIWDADGQGFERLQKKAARYKYLHAPING